jgi:threonine synthase
MLSEGNEAGRGANERDPAATAAPASTDRRAATVQEPLVVHLECLRCGRIHDGARDGYLCKACGYGSGPSDAGVLDVRYDYARARERLFDGRRIRSDRTDLFRYLPLLPVARVPDMQRAGGTALFPAPRLAVDLGLRHLTLKDETRNPTRALKDRATAVGVARAAERGYTDIVCASAGNAAISMAGFAANIGLRAHAYVPHNASEVRLDWLRRFGAEVYRSTGDYDFAYDEAEAMRAQGWYSRNCAFNPYLVEGKKTAALEIAEQLDWRVPDLVVCPVGDACTLGAIGKGFRELAEMGVTDRLPRLVGIQAAGTRPLVDRFLTEHNGWPQGPDEADTAAASMNVKHPRNAKRLLNEIDATDGVLLAVDDDAIAAAQGELAERAGIVAEFTSAATLAGLRRLAELESLEGRTATLVITGGRLDDA